MGIRQWVLGAAAFSCAIGIALPAESESAPTQNQSCSAADFWRESHDRAHLAEQYKAFMDDLYVQFDKQFDAELPKNLGVALNKTIKMAFKDTAAQHAGSHARLVIYSVSTSFQHCDYVDAQACDGIVFTPQSPEMQRDNKLTDNPIVTKSLLGGDYPKPFSTIMIQFYNPIDSSAHAVTIAEIAGSFTPDAPIRMLVDGMQDMDRQTPDFYNRGLSSDDYRRPFTRTLACRNPASRLAK
jgi:hypothetical protein